MAFTVWCSTRDFAEYIINHTRLIEFDPEINFLAISDGTTPKKFHAQPDHIKKILYLDSPDIIVEFNNEPIFSIEISAEAGTGHNAFQRFARLAASVENGVPAIYIYPEAKIISREVKRNNSVDQKWDKINPLILYALEQVMQIHEIPALLFYYPSDYKFYPDPLTSPHQRDQGLVYDEQFPSSPDSGDSEMRSMFLSIDIILNLAIDNGPLQSRSLLLRQLEIRNRRNLMQSWYYEKADGRSADTMSPLSAVKIVPTKSILKYIENTYGNDYQISGLIPSRAETVVYVVDAKYRGDPYPGALCAIDYLACRSGKTFEERTKNLVLCWGDMSINEMGDVRITSAKATIKDFVADVVTGEKRSLLQKNFNTLKTYEIPRYYMQVRYGSMFSKNKEVRIYAYFADAIIFPDGCLWREG
jgi:hypothetical protein